MLRRNNPASRALGMLLLGAAILTAPAVRAAQGELRVCADPNNLPFSNDRGEGFENKLAELIAADLDRTVSYVWWAQRRGFIRQTLKAGRCDVVMGMPAGLDMVATTRPYYRSTYVFVSRTDRHLALASIADPRLQQLRIGVHLIGNDGFNTPPAHALGEQGIVANVVGYLIYGDYREPNPPARLIEAVARKEVDLAAVWGPVAGYFAPRSAVPLQLHAIEDTDRFPPFAFQYDIALAVRKDDGELLAQLDRVLLKERSRIDALLAEYGVPVVARRPGLSAARGDG